jgi:hypothetical protein
MFWCDSRGWVHSDERRSGRSDRLRKTLEAIEVYLGKAMERQKDVAWRTQDELEQAIEESTSSGC